METFDAVEIKKMRLFLTGWHGCCWFVGMVGGLGGAFEDGSKGEWRDDGGCCCRVVEVLVLFFFR